MSNVLSEEKRQQVIALERLGWSLRRIEQDCYFSIHGWPQSFGHTEQVFPLPNYYY